MALYNKNGDEVNLQTAVRENQDRIAALEAASSSVDLDAVNNITYDSTNGATIGYDGGITMSMPIIPGNGIHIDATDDHNHIEVKLADQINLADAQTLSVHSGEIDVNMIEITPTTIGLNSNGGDIFLKVNNKSGLDYFSDKTDIGGTLAVGDTGEIIDWVLTNAYYEISGVPASSTSGILPNNQSYFELTVHPERFRLLFNKEFYQLSDNEHTTGTLVFSHVGYESDQLIIKTITITIATRSWVLTTIKPYMKSVQAAISLLDNIYYSPTYPIQHGQDTYKYLVDYAFPEGFIPLSGAFKYGDNTYILESVSLASIQGGGVVSAFNLSTGAMQELTFSTSQLYIDEIVNTPQISS